MEPFPTLPNLSDGRARSYLDSSLSPTRASSRGGLRTTSATGVENVAAISSRISLRPSEVNSSTTQFDQNFNATKKDPYMYQHTHHVLLPSPNTQPPLNGSTYTTTTTTTTTTTDVSNSAASVINKGSTTFASPLYGPIGENSQPPHRSTPLTAPTKYQSDDDGPSHHTNNLNNSAVSSPSMVGRSGGYGSGALSSPTLTMDNNNNGGVGGGPRRIRALVNTLRETAVLLGEDPAALNAIEARRAKAIAAINKSLPLGSYIRKDGKGFSHYDNEASTLMIESSDVAVAAVASAAAVGGAFAAPKSSVSSSAVGISSGLGVGAAYGSGGLADFLDGDEDEYGHVARDADREAPISFISPEGLPPDLQNPDSTRTVPQFVKDIVTHTAARQRLHLRLFHEHLSDFLEFDDTSQKEWEMLLATLFVLARRRGGLSVLQRRYHEEVSEISFDILFALLATPQKNPKFPQVLTALNSLMRRLGCKKEEEMLEQFFARPKRPTDTNNAGEEERLGHEEEEEEDEDEDNENVDHHDHYDNDKEKEEANEKKGHQQKGSYGNNKESEEEDDGENEPDVSHIKHPSASSPPNATQTSTKKRKLKNSALTASSITKNLTMRDKIQNVDNVYPQWETDDDRDSVASSSSHSQPLQNNDRGDGDNNNNKDEEKFIANVTNNTKKQSSKQDSAEKDQQLHDLLTDAAAELPAHPYYYSLDSLTDPADRGDLTEDEFLLLEDWFRSLPSSAAVINDGNAMVVGGSNSSAVNEAEEAANLSLIDSLRLVGSALIRVKQSKTILFVSSGNKPQSSSVGTSSTPVSAPLFIGRGYLGSRYISDKTLRDFQSLHAGVLTASGKRLPGGTCSFFQLMNFLFPTCPEKTLLRRCQQVVISDHIFTIDKLLHPDGPLQKFLREQHILSLMSGPLKLTREAAEDRLYRVAAGLPLLFQPQQGIAANTTPTANTESTPSFNGNASQEPAAAPLSATPKTVAGTAAASRSRPPTPSGGGGARRASSSSNPSAPRRASVVAKPAAKGATVARPTSSSSASSPTPAAAATSNPSTTTNVGASSSSSATVLLSQLQLTPEAIEELRLLLISERNRFLAGHHPSSGTEQYIAGDKIQKEGQFARARSDKTVVRAQKEGGIDDYSEDLLDPHRVAEGTSTADSQTVVSAREEVAVPNGTQNNSGEESLSPRSKAKKAARPMTPHGSTAHTIQQVKSLRSAIAYPDPNPSPQNNSGDPRHAGEDVSSNSNNNNMYPHQGDLGSTSPLKAQGGFSAGHSATNGSGAGGVVLSGPLYYIAPSSSLAGSSPQITTLLGAVSVVHSNSNEAKKLFVSNNNNNNNNNNNSVGGVSGSPLSASSAVRPPASSLIRGISSHYYNISSAPPALQLAHKIFPGRSRWSIQNRLILLQRTDWGSGALNHELRITHAVVQQQKQRHNDGATLSHAPSSNTTTAGANNGDANTQKQIEASSVSRDASNEKNKNDSQKSLLDFAMEEAAIRREAFLSSPYKLLSPSDKTTAADIYPAYNEGLLRPVTLTISLAVALLEWFHGFFDWTHSGAVSVQQLVDLSEAQSKLRKRQMKAQEKMKEHRERVAAGDGSDAEGGESSTASNSDDEAGSDTVNMNTSNSTGNRQSSGRVPDPYVVYCGDWRIDLDELLEYKQGAVVFKHQQETLTRQSPTHVGNQPPPSHDHRDLLTVSGGGGDENELRRDELARSPTRHHPQPRRLVHRKHLPSTLLITFDDIVRYLFLALDSSDISHNNNNNNNNTASPTRGGETPTSNISRGHVVGMNHASYATTHTPSSSSNQLYVDTFFTGGSKNDGDSDSKNVVAGGESSVLTQDLPDEHSQQITPAVPLLFSEVLHQPFARCRLDRLAAVVQTATRLYVEAFNASVEGTHSRNEGYKEELTQYVNGMGDQSQQLYQVHQAVETSAARYLKEKTQLLSFSASPNKIATTTSTGETATSQAAPNIPPTSASVASTTVLPISSASIPLSLPAILVDIVNINPAGDISTVIPYLINVSSKDTCTDADTKVTASSVEAKAGGVESGSRPPTGSPASRAAATAVKLQQQQDDSAEDGVALSSFASPSPLRYIRAPILLQHSARERTQIVTERALRIRHQFVKAYKIGRRRELIAEAMRAQFNTIQQGLREHISVEKGPFLKVPPVFYNVFGLCVNTTILDLSFFAARPERRIQVRELLVCLDQSGIPARYFVSDRNPRLYSHVPVPSGFSGAGSAVGACGAYGGGSREGGQEFAYCAPIHVYRDFAFCTQRPSQHRHWPTGQMQCVHVVTNIPVKSGIKFRFHFEGYNFGANAPINTIMVGSADTRFESVGSLEYFGWPDQWDRDTVLNKGLGFQSVTPYISENGKGFVCFELAAKSLMHVGFGVSAWLVNHGYGGKHKLTARFVHQLERL